jgi:hypothetical protein
MVNSLDKQSVFILDGQMFFPTDLKPCHYFADSELFASLREMAESNFLVFIPEYINSMARVGFRLKIQTLASSANLSLTSSPP